MKNTKTLAMTQIALLGAVICVLAFTPGIGYIPLGVTRATIVHIPVIVGSIILGPKKGAVLGFLFGMTSFINNTINPTVTSFTFTPFYNGGNFWSLVICFVPRILVGVLPYFVYAGVKFFFDKLIGENSRGSKTVSLALAGLAGSLTNTILVMVGIAVFFGDAYSAANEILPEALFSVILSVIGINGLPEAVVAAVLTVAITGALMKYLGRHASAASR